MTPNRMNPVAVGHDIFVGGWSVCNIVRAEPWPLAVHIYRPEDFIRDEPNFGRGACKSLRGPVSGRDPDHMFLEWREEQGIDQLPVPYADFLAYCRRAGPLFIHCAGGATRSPALTLAAKIARGCEPFDAIRDIAEAIYLQAGFFVGWRRETVEQILNRHYQTIR